MYEVENAMVVDWYWTAMESYSDEAELVEDLLDVEDDERDELEAEYGSMSAVDEFTLAEIVEAHTGIEPVAVEWDDRFDTIFYKYFEEVA